MQINSNWFNTDCRPLNPSPDFEFNKELISLLLFSWGLKEAQMTSLAIRFMLCEKAPTAKLLRAKPGMYTILFPFKLLEDLEELNRATVHELRHLWWNIKRGEDVFPLTAEYEKEEADCCRAEGVHCGLRLIRQLQPVSQQLQLQYFV